MAKELRIRDEQDNLLYPVTVTDLVFNDQTGETLTEELEGKQETLESGTNIKTINGQSVLGSGNIAFNEATTSNAGLMSAADKTKLDNVASTYETKADATSKQTAINTTISELQAQVAQLSGVDNAFFGGIVGASTDIATDYSNNGYSGTYLYMVGTDMSSLVAYQYSGSGSPTQLFSGATYDFTDYSDVKQELTALGPKIDEVANGMIVTTQNGFFVIDSAKRIGLKYTNDGLDAAKVTDHLKSLLGGGEGGGVDEGEVQEIVEELLENAGIQLVPNIVTWAKADDDVHLLEHWSDVTFGVLTDIHGAGTELKAFIDFCNHYSTPYMIHLGDTVVDKYSDGVAFWTNVTDSNKVLNTIGNHDTRYGSTGSNWWYYANKQQSYDTFIKPFIQQNIQGVVQPSDAASTYKCYYYVDLYKGSTATNVRLIVLDSMSWYDNAAGAAQYSWLDSLLSASRTAGKHVVICTHIPINDADVIANCPFDNSSISPNSSPIDTTLAGESSYLDRYITPSSSNVPNAMTLSNLVESHITQGLIFVAYMCGHTHANYLGTIKNHPNQLQIVIPTGKDWSSPAFEDNVIYKYCFSLCGINAESKRLMLFRFGKTTQRWGFDTKSFSYNYETHKVVQVNGNLTFN